ncbi:PREDICTED: protein kintoun-like isoform X2 [Branchiostoma belcheri]|uniref:Protein kintoun n=1 Tax=Branchiostoma belcheri TaxID=7741 RepID=A0A6P4YSH0_BRABE|nr:PREDICTED: protein kintoun-like isoform X1 [Branchiostoma belcheri]XP_019624660.1 PREDICTED: protein kintoun-like isoform X2 [Branchiostoma belcheri]
MASGRQKLEDLNMTQDELQRFEKAFKSEEFRKLFAEYAEEISDPENRKRYEAEITAMERERGTDVTFINPEPHYVIKTSLDGEKKCFINICANQHVEKPSSQPCMQGEGPNRRIGETWSVPHSLTPGREDLDKNKQRCMVYDVVFHQETLEKAAGDKRFKQMVNDIAFSAIERQFQVKLDKTNIKFPKIKYKGTPTATVMRKRLPDGPQTSPDNDDDPIQFPYPYSPPSGNTEKTKETQSSVRPNEENEPEQKQDFTVPKYTIKHRSEFDIQNFREAPDAAPSTRPKELVVDIDFPLLKSAAKLELDIFEKQLKVESKKPAYKLDISLPYPVDENEGSAKFDKSKRQLTVTLVVKPAPQEDLPFTAGRTEDRQLVEEVTDVQVGGKAEENHVQDGGSTENILPTEVSEMETDSRDKNPSATETEGTGTGPVSDVATAATTIDASDKDIFKEEDELQSSSTSLDLPSDSATPASTTPVSTTPDRATPASPTCPDYTYRQDEDSMTIVIHVPNIIEKNISKTYSTSSYIISVQFQAAGTTGLQYYQLFVVLLDGNTVVRSQTSVDVSPHNAVLLLHKDNSCKGLWSSFKAGVDIMNLEEKQFLTEDSVKAAVQAVVREGQAVATDTSSVKVTEASEDKLAIELTDVSGVQDQEEMGGKPTSATVDGNLDISPQTGKSSIKERVSEVIEGGQKGEGLDSDDDDADDSGSTQGTEAVNQMVLENTVSGKGDGGPVEMVQDEEDGGHVPTGKTKRRRRKRKGKTQAQSQDSNTGTEAGPGVSDEKGGHLEGRKEDEDRKASTSSKLEVSEQSTIYSESEKEAATQDTVGFNKTIINTGRERKNSGKKSVTFSDNVEIHKLDDERNGKGKKKQKGKKNNQNGQKVANGHRKTEGEPTMAANVSEEVTVPSVSNTESTPEHKPAGQGEVGDGDVKKGKSDPAKKSEPQAVDALTIRDVSTGEEEVVTEHRAECAVQFTNKVMFELD